MVRDSSASPRGSQGYNSSVTAQTPFNNSVFNSVAPQKAPNNAIDPNEPRFNYRLGRPINHTDKAGGFYLDPPPGKPIEPWDCQHYPASPYCGGIPITPARTSFGIPQIRIDKCNICVCTTPSLGFVALPTNCICYKLRGCKDDPPPAKPSPKANENKRVEKPPQTNLCGDALCAGIGIRSHEYSYEHDGGCGWAEQTITRKILDVQFPPSNLKTRDRQTPTGVSYTEDAIIYIKTSTNAIFDYDDLWGGCYRAHTKGMHFDETIIDETWLYQSDFSGHDASGATGIGFPGAGAEEYGQCYIGSYEDSDMQTVLTHISIENHYYDTVPIFEGIYGFECNNNYPPNITYVGKYGNIILDQTGIGGTFYGPEMGYSGGFTNKHSKTEYTAIQICSNAPSYKPKKPPVPPAPPPPKKECKCMPDCGCDCETIRLMIAREMKAVKSAVGASDDNQVFPISVPSSFLTDRGDDTIQINSLPEQISYTLKQLDSLIGQFPVPIEITGDNGEVHQASITNIAEAFGELLLLALSTSQSEKTLVNIGLRNLVETASTKNTVLTSHEMLDCIMHFLAFKTKQVQTDVTYTYNPTIDLSQDGVSLDDLLKETTVQVKTEEYDDDVDLKDQLHKLLFSAGIIKSVFWRAVPTDDSGEGIIASILKDGIDFASGGLTTQDGVTTSTEQTLDFLIQQIQTNYGTVSGIPEDEKEHPYGRNQDRAPQITKLNTQDPNQSTQNSSGDSKG